jgi:Tfp pilus assembly protein PilO
VKKKLAALDLKIQIGLVVVGLLIFGYAGNTIAVAPQNAQAASLQKQVTSQQDLIYKRKASLRAGLHTPTIKVADLFRLARAMPDREDMPGMILTLSQVARESGIKFDLIEPVLGGTPAVAGNYTQERIHLLFNGDFYGLSDFLYRLRSLVAVHHGKLQADGRLFNVDTVTFQVAAQKFPQISAELYVDAYIYGGSTTGATTTATGGTSTTPTSTDSTSTTPTTTTTSTDSSLPGTATAAGPTP